MPRRAPRGAASGSTSTSSDELPETPTQLEIARVVTPHGLRGELSCAIVTDFPERFQHTKDVLVGDPPVRRELAHYRLHGDRIVLKLCGVDDRTAAEVLRGAPIRVPVEQAVELPAGTYFWHQILGLRVEDVHGRQLGVIRDILRTGANDVYVVATDRGELLLPAIKDVVRDIDVEANVMRVELMPGLEA